MSGDLLIDFERGAHDAAKPIFRIAEKSDDLSAAPANLQTLANLNGFSGGSGALLVGEAGVLLGVGDGSDPFILAAASEKLPEGDYKILGDFKKRDALAWALGSYRFTKYKTSKKAAARLIAPENIDAGSSRRIARAVFLARDLVNTPAGDMLPDSLERAARDLAEMYGAEIEVTLGDALLEKNFPMIHAVGRASSTSPRLIDLKWGRQDAPKVTLVGKGVCFDSGGLDIKGAAGMLLMKKDMGGAANALGLAQLIMDEKIDIRLRVLIPAVENAISGNAFRPGDILKSRQGVTVEIGNTDAEGRLVLADAMAFGAEDDPNAMVTLATLTGAARAALGPDLPPFYCDDDEFAEAVLSASNDVADPVWRMPLWKPYQSMLSSTIADTNNVGGDGFAGSVTAALFLQKFAPRQAVWAHFDIYAWRPKSLPGRPVGGEAQAIRAVFEAIKRGAVR